MPEHEIAKHTKAIYKAWNEPNKKVRERVIEIFIAIAIIVFAISLSLLLERWRENQHERKVEKKFLIGLKQDLHNDVIQLRSDSASYFNLLNAWSYLRRTGINNETVNYDSLNKYGNTLTNTTDFIPNYSRFEALKSSG